MNRYFSLLLCLVLVICLSIGVSAADSTRATSVNVIATVSSSGNCEVTSAVTIHVDTPPEKLTYPVPLNASNITLNGSSVITEKTQQARLVNLTKTLGGMSGDFSFTVGYTIRSAVSVLPSDGTDSDLTRVRLEVPLLAGFDYPIDQLQFSINLPGNPSQNPSFVSGYHQTNIEKDLTFSVSGGNIAGRSWTALKDHETLTMYLDATEEMFPQSHVDLPDAEDVTTLIKVCAVAALLFWLLFLRNWLPIRDYPAVAPEGFGAGQLGTVLAMEGANLNLMVFSWAQLGYVHLRMDRRGRVSVEKRMEMGNERTAFERKCFTHLFSRRNRVDTGAPAYQRLQQTVRLQKSAPQLFRGHGSLCVKIFRVMISLAGLFTGTCFGIALGNLLDFGWVLVILLSAAGLVSSWYISFWPRGVFLHYRFQLWIAAIACLLWLALGMAINHLSLALLAVGIPIVGGFLAVFGGRRTEDGRIAMGQTLRLRSYLKRLSKAQAQQLCRDNPEVFFDLAPFAIALGCSGTFARRFGKSRMPVCPYVLVGDSRGLTARQWNQRLTQMLGIMTLGQRKSPRDTLKAVLRNYMR